MDFPFDSSYLVAGNMAKVAVQQSLSERLERGRNLSVLDVGCIGLQPLDFWKPLLSRFDNLELTGIDVQGIKKGQAVVDEMGWTAVKLLRGSGYDLNKLFEEDSFDIVVATQVLEHMAQPLLFFRGVEYVLRSGGEVFISLDSAHFSPRFSTRRLYRLLKNVVKRILAIFGNERYYDLPWFDHEVRELAQSSNLEVMSVKYFNIHPLKFLHNHVIPEEQKNLVAWHWFELERLLNEKVDTLEASKHLFLGLYFHLKKVK